MNSQPMAIQTAARQFVQTHYASEAALFSMFWQTFEIRWDVQNPPSDTQDQRALLSELAFSQQSSMDLVTPVVLATVNDAILRIQAGNHSDAAVADCISTAAARFGAGAELTARLVRHLPGLCREALAADPDSRTAQVAAAPAVQYQIWTGGQSCIVDDISEYEQRKESFLFWLDLNDRTHVSPVSPKHTISTTAVELLRLLVENLNVPIPAATIAEAESKQNKTADSSDVNRIEQQLSKLNKFSGGRFREYLFGNWVKGGLGLKSSFADQYFLFLRLCDTSSQ